MQTLSTMPVAKANFEPWKIQVLLYTDFYFAPNRCLLYKIQKVQINKGKYYPWSHQSTVNHYCTNSEGHATEQCVWRSVFTEGKTCIPFRKRLEVEVQGQNVDSVKWMLPQILRLPCKPCINQHPYQLWMSCIPSTLLTLSCIFLYRLCQTDIKNCLIVPFLFSFLSFASLCPENIFLRQTYGKKGSDWQYK